LYLARQRQSAGTRDVGFFQTSTPTTEELAALGSAVGAFKRKQTGVVSAGVREQVTLQKVNDFRSSRNKTLAQSREETEKWRLRTSRRKMEPSPRVTHTDYVEDILRSGQLKTAVSTGTQANELVERYDPRYRWVQEWKQRSPRDLFYFLRRAERRGSGEETRIRTCACGGQKELEKAKGGL